MNLKEKKEIIHKALDQMKGKIDKLPGRVTELGAIVMAGANPWKEDTISPSGEAIGDEIALKACIIHAISHHAARAYTSNGTPICRTIAMFERAIRSDDFAKMTMGVIKETS